MNETTLNVAEALSADPVNASAPHDDPRQGCTNAGVRGKEGMGSEKPSDGEGMGRQKPGGSSTQQ